jgi:hypothetical protein
VAAGLSAAFLGGCMGFVAARIVVERFAVVEGPPAGVLLVLIVAVLACLTGVVGFILAFRSLRKHTVADPPLRRQ